MSYLVQQYESVDRPVTLFDLWGSNVDIGSLLGLLVLTLLVYRKVMTSTPQHEARCEEDASLEPIGKLGIHCHRSELGHAWSARHDEVAFKRWLMPIVALFRAKRAIVPIIEAKADCFADFAPSTAECAPSASVHVSSTADPTPSATEHPPSVTDCAPYAADCAPSIKDSSSSIVEGIPTSDVMKTVSAVHRLANSMEAIAKYRIDGYLDAVFETLWGSSDFINALLAEEEPVIGEWSGDIRSVRCRHPLSINVPRWCGIGNLSIPTTKQQQRADNIILERSSFSGIPLADAFAVETAWLFTPTADGATVVTVRYRCTFDAIVPSWLRPLIVTKTRAELLSFNENFAFVARGMVASKSSSVAAGTSEPGDSLDAIFANGAASHHARRQRRDLNLLSTVDYGESSVQPECPIS